MSKYWCGECSFMRWPGECKHSKAKPVAPREMSAEAKQLLADMKTANPGVIERIVSNYGVFGQVLRLGGDDPTAALIKKMKVIAEVLFSPEGEAYLKDLVALIKEQANGRPDRHGTIPAQGPGGLGGDGPCPSPQGSPTSSSCYGKVPFACYPPEPMHPVDAEVFQGANAVTEAIYGATGVRLDLSEDANGVIQALTPTIEDVGTIYKFLSEMPMNPGAELLEIRTVEKDGTRIPSFVKLRIRDGGTVDMIAEIKSGV